MVSFRPGIDPIPQAFRQDEPVVKPVIASSDFVKRCVNAAQVIWKTKSVVPTVELVCNELYGPNAKNKSHVAKVMASTEFSETCAARGIPTDNANGLSPAQVYAVSIITNPTDKRPMAAKLKSAGITYSRYSNWLRNPQFAAYVKTIGDQLLSDHIADVNAALTNKATSGDTTAMRIYYELNGMLGQKDQPDQDLHRVITLLLEVITRQLASYPALLQAISGDIKVIMEGGTPNSDLPLITSEVVRSDTPSGDYNG